MLGFLKTNEHTRKHVNTTIAIVLLCSSLALAAAGLYAARDTIRGGIGYYNANVPGWVQVGVLAAFILASLITVISFVRYLIPWLRRELLQKKLRDKKTFRVTGGDFWKNTEGHPTSQEKWVDADLTTGETAAANEVLAWYPDETDMMGGRSGTRLSRTATVTELPTPAVGANHEEGADLRTQEREKVTARLNKLASRAGIFKAIFLTFAFSNDPSRSNTLTTVEEEFSEDFARLPTRSLFIEVHTRPRSVEKSIPLNAAGPSKVAPGPWHSRVAPTNTPNNPEA